VSGACEALLGGAPQPLVSARSCLNHPYLDGPFDRLRSGLPFRIRRFGAGSPEFTRCCNHSFLWKLQFGVNFPMAIGTKEHTFIQFLTDPVPSFGYSPYRRFRSPCVRFSDDETPTLLSIGRIHISDNARPYEERLYGEFLSAVSGRL
jgi:hypothetical protein